MLSSFIYVTYPQSTELVCNVLVCVFGIHIHKGRRILSVKAPLGDRLSLNASAKRLHCWCDTLTAAVGRSQMNQKD